MATITVKCNPGKVVKGLDTFKKGVIRNLITIARKYLRMGVQDLKIKHMSGPTSPTSVKSLTGALKRSVHIIEPTLTGQKITGGITIGDKDTPYVRVHVGSPRGKETVIKAAPGKALAVPTKFAMTAKGKPRGKPLDPIWGITFIASNMIWGYQRGTKREYAHPKPLFILKKSVVERTRIDPKEDFVKVILPPLRKELKMLVKTSRSAG
jgi:hypothetical protein